MCTEDMKHGVGIPKNEEFSSYTTTKHIYCLLKFFPQPSCIS